MREVERDVELGDPPAPSPLVWGWGRYTLKAVRILRGAVLGGVGQVPGVPSPLVLFAAAYLVPQKYRLASSLLPSGGGGAWRKGPLPGSCIALGTSDWRALPQ